MEPKRILNNRNTLDVIILNDGRIGINTYYSITIFNKEDYKPEIKYIKEEERVEIIKVRNFSSGFVQLSDLTFCIGLENNLKILKIDNDKRKFEEIQTLKGIKI